MKRKEFIKVCGLLGISIPFQSILSSCNENDDNGSSFSGSVLIIGAGAAGMAAGYLLAQKRIEFQILEASSTYGGRMKRITTFADFPIPLGAEWLHVPESGLSSIVNDSSVQITTQMQAYDNQDQVGYYENGVLSFSTLSNAFGTNFVDKKFINSTWFDFFEDYIVSSIESKMSFNSEIISIDYQGTKVIATDSNGLVYEADKIIVTAPLKILQDGDIVFTPQLPSSHRNAIQDAPIWGGIKVFIEFSEKFYPTYLEFLDSFTQTGQRVYYDAAYAQNASSNILGLFAVGLQAEQYQSLSGEAQKAFILNELDQIFDNKASQNYIKHIVQNWNEEPFIKGAYLADVAPTSISRRLSNSVNDKVYFAGDAYTQEDDWSGVHNAARSARSVVEEIG